MQCQQCTDSNLTFVLIHYTQGFLNAKQQTDSDTKVYSVCILVCMSITMLLLYYYYILNISITTIHDCNKSVQAVYIDPRERKWNTISPGVCLLHGFLPLQPPPPVTNMLVRLMGHHKIHHRCSCERELLCISLHLVQLSWSLIGKYKKMNREILHALVLYCVTLAWLVSQSLASTTVICSLS